MTRRELGWCLGYSAFLVVLTSVPYVLGVLAQGSEWGFTGFVFAVEDGNSYVAKMLTGQQGAWLFISPYSTAPQRGVLAFLPYLLLGKLSNGSHSQLVVLFHLFRIVAIPILVLAVYRFAALFMSSLAWRRWVTILATAGGGLGWTLLLLGASDWLGSLPLEYNSPEAFGFLAIFGLPHLVLARAGLLTAAAAYLAHSRGGVAGLALLATGIVHPPALLPAVAAVLAHQVSLLGYGTVKWRKFAQVLAPSLPLVAYLAWSLARDPYLRAWASQNLILSPHPAHYLLAYGAVLPAAAWGARRLLRNKPTLGLFLIGWVIVTPALVYAPVGLQRRLAEGVWVALLVLAGVGLESVAKRRARLLRIATSGLLLPSSALLVVFGVQTSISPSNPAFRSSSEVETFEALRREAPPGSTVLAAFETSNAIPAWTPLAVVAGHGPESAGLTELLPQIFTFYAKDTSDEARMAFLAGHGVDYVVWGPRERALGRVDLSESACFTSVYRSVDYELLAVCES